MKHEHYNRVHFFLDDPRSVHHSTGLFISPSGISDLCGTVTGMVTPKGSMSTERESLQVSVLPYKCSTCPPLVTRQMSNLAILANSKTQNGFLFPVHAMFRHDCPLAIKPASTPRRPVHKKKLWEILYLFICSFLLCLSWLLRSGVRNFRRDLWINLCNSYRNSPQDATVYQNLLFHVCKTRGC
jgi:hypothetical protein